MITTLNPIAAIVPIFLTGFGAVLSGQTPIFSDDFSAPAKLSNNGAAAYLGGGTGSGDLYSGQFGTWVHHSFNGGIDVAGSGSEDGSNANNRYSSIGLNRPSAFRSTNARASWVVLEGSNFTDGVEYTVSFDVVGDPQGLMNGRYWLAELYGYDASGDNNIQGRGVFPGWGGGQKPWTASGSATVFFLEDSGTNGVPLAGDTGSGTTPVSFNFTYDGSNGADIGFAVGTYNSAFGIDNLEVVEASEPAPETVIWEDGFSSSAPLLDGAASGFLGTGGTGIDYNGEFGAWVSHSFNGGIDEAGSGSEDGSGPDNRYSSIGLNRPSAFRSTNARASWVVFESSDFTDGTEYTLSFDVIGDPAGDLNGRHWLAALSGYDSSGTNFIQAQGAFPGWGGGQKPWTASGSATVDFIEDSATNNGVPLSGETFGGSTEVSFNFTYDGSSGADIGFALGTFNNAFAIDNFKIVEFVPEPPVVPSLQNTDKPNFIIMIPDDQRWDAMGFVQAAMAGNSLPNQRIARFPYLSGNTPGFDTLADQGVVFQNSFAVASLCSPARATMLTGLHAHKHGITDNKNPFPENLVTYATLLQDHGYLTGYFGKWHMGEQRERPGFDRVATFLNQGTYFGDDFYDANGVKYPPDNTTWVDDRSTNYALDFIDEQVEDGQPFLAVVGFKSPHTPRTPPDRESTTFNGLTPEDVPNLQETNGVVPLWDPGATQGANPTDTRNYMKTVAGIDDNIVSILNKLDQPGWEDVRGNTVVIYISDQGYFRNEHGQGDKRAPYEESIRIPFIIRYPNLQTNREATGKIALNMDLAPTILDIAGVEVPEAMQGRSLKPLIENPTQAPEDWRDSFLFTYNYDQEFPNGGVPEYVAIRNENGDKYVEYAENSAWNELFTGNDLYEIDNKINDPAYADLLSELRTELRKKSAEEGFLRVGAVQNHQGFLSLDLDAGDSFLYELIASDDLQDWTQVSEFEGSDAPLRVDLITEPPAEWDVTIFSDPQDYAVAPGDLVADESSSVVLAGGSGPDLRNAVLLFELPAPPQLGVLPSHAQLRVAATKKFSKFDIDLFALGYTSNATDRILEYHTSEPGPDTVKLQDTFLSEDVPHATGAAAFTFDTYYSSNLNSALTSHLRDFYEANPNYTGNQLIHLRLSPNVYLPFAGTHFRIKMANDDATASGSVPELKLKWEDPSAPAPAHNKMFFRVRPGSR